MEEFRYQHTLKFIEKRFELVDSFELMLSKIKPVSRVEEGRLQAHLDNLTKPVGSLGRLEELAKDYCLKCGVSYPHIPKKCVVVFAADHGVTQENVSLYPKEVTYQMVRNFLNGGAGINVLARHAGADVKIVDIGVDHVFDNETIQAGLYNKKVIMGTKNMVNGPAMTKDEVISAITAGIEMAGVCVQEGFGLLATGEMGIGNTTAASAVTAVLCHKTPEEVTGRGTGISESVRINKINIIEKSIALNRPDPSDPIDVLAKVGGAEIAGICGFILGAALHKVPVITDGFISTAGALAACRISIHAKDYIFASHVSVEKGHRIQLEQIGIKPLLDMGLRLGEGTGAALAMTLIDAAIKIFTEMATFESAGVSN